MPYIENSDIPAELIGHYLSASYQVMIDTDVITLSIDQHSKSLSQLFATSGHKNAVFITAFNPFNQQKTPQENSISNSRLYLALKQQTNLILESASSDPSGKIAVEKSFLALGIDLKTSKILGKHFKQNAIVWIGANAAPQLILLR